MNIIEKLKDKSYVRAFGLMKEEERLIYLKAKIENCLILTDMNLWRKPIKEIFGHGTTYIINPSYQPEPEYVNLEIEKNDEGWLGVWKVPCLKIPRSFIHLHCLPSLPNFEEFHLKEGLIINLVHVASYYSKKQKVYARFRKAGGENVLPEV